jgi:hypothetical protein
VRLLDINEIPIRYEITDDHGLTHVDLVLRACAKESRRVLAKHDGTLTFDPGSSVLHRHDRFLSGAHMPVEVTVEARDNDPVGGPKWGRSSPVVLVPPAVGEEEALRYEAHRDVRNALLDQLASRLETRAPATGEERNALATRERNAHAAFEQSVKDAAERRYGGIQMPRRMRSFLDDQFERLTKATGGACPSGSEQACRKGLERLGDVTGDTVLALDTHRL